MENDRPMQEVQDNDGVGEGDARSALSRRALLAGGAGVAGLVAGAGLLGRNQAASAAPAAAGIQTNVSDPVEVFLQYKNPSAGLPIPVGESLDKTFTNWTQVPEFAFAGENPHALGSGTGGGGVGKLKFDQFTITKFVDNTSPQLFRAMAVGGHFGEVLLAIRKSGGSLSSSGQPYLTFTFGLVFVTDIQWSYQAEVPQEQVTFAYGQMNIEYHKQSPTGTLGPANSFGWDETMNKSWSPPPK